MLTLSEMAQEEIERAVSDDALDVGLAFSDVLAQDVEWLPLHMEQLSLIVGQEHSAATGDREMDTAALAAESLALLAPTFATRVRARPYAPLSKACHLSRVSISTGPASRAFADRLQG